jgi:hypothetical protein
MEYAKPQPRVHAVFDKTMILFHDIMSIRALSEKTVRREYALLLKDLKSGWIRGVLVHGNHTGDTCM